MARILIVEDEVMIAEDLAATCQSYGYDIVEPAYAPGDALNKLQNERIDLVLLDINLESDVNGIEIAHYIKENLQIPIIYITSYTDTDTIAAARDTSPMAYITKPFKRADIHATIEIALQNHRDFMDKGLPGFDKINADLADKITYREYELLQQIHLGKSNQEMAHDLHISLHTVKSHLKNCYRKLGVSSRISALTKVLNL